MTRLEIIKIVRKLVVKGQIKKALVLLYAYTEGVDKELESDIVLLQSSLTTNQEQYEIKQIITKQEHDLTQSRTILAIENLLDKLGRKFIYYFEDVQYHNLSTPEHLTKSNTPVIFATLYENHPHGDHDDTPKELREYK